MSETKTEAKTLDERQREARKEIVIPINPKALARAYTKLIYDKPIGALQWVAKKVDDFAINKRMRNGGRAVVTMPLGIMLRNGARATHQLAEGKYAHVGQWLGGGAAAIGGWAAAGLALKGALASTFVGTLGGAVGTTAVGFALTLPVVVPAAMIGVAALSTAIGLGITAISVVPAALNVKTGFLRTLDRLKGIKGVDYDGPAEEKAISYDSLRAREERNIYREVSWQIDSLSEEHQKDIYERLSKQFGKAADPATQQQQAVATPAAKRTAAPKP